MERLISASYSILDYDGDLQRFDREGYGKQDWPEFCYFSGKWKNNKANGQGKLTFRHIPLEIEGEFIDNSLRDGNLTFGNSDITFEGSFDSDLSLSTGIIFLKGNSELHFSMEEGNITNFALLKDGEAIDNSEYLSEGVLRYPLTKRKDRVFQFDFHNNLIELYFVDGDQVKDDICYEIDIKRKTYSLLMYEQGKLVGQQFKLEMNRKNPSITSWWVYPEDDDENDITFFANNSKMVNKVKTESAKLSYTGYDSYISGKKRRNNLRGPCDLIVDGKYNVPAEFTDDGLLFKNPKRLLQVIENVKEHNMDEKDGDLLNGFNRYEYANGIVYEGFFLNDFVYCHKDSLLSCIKHLNRSRHPDLEAFFAKIKRFEGIIQKGKILGKCKVRYLNDDTFEGQYDEYFMRTGTGIQFSNDGMLYSGEFRHDKYNGIGKLFTPDQQFLLGVFENGELKLQFDIDNLDANWMAQLKAQFYQGGDINEEGLKDLEEEELDELEKRKKEEQRAKEERLKKMLEDEKRRKRAETERIIAEMNNQMVVNKIYSFKNGYAFHGKIKGDLIVDNQEGDILDPDGVRIPVRYRFVKDLNVGMFRSLDKRHVFIYKYANNELAHVDLQKENKDKGVFKNEGDSDFDSQEGKEEEINRNEVSNLLEGEETEKVGSNVFLQDSRVVEEEPVKEAEGEELKQSEAVG